MQNAPPRLPTALLGVNPVMIKSLLGKGGKVVRKIGKMFQDKIAGILKAIGSANFTHWSI